MSNVLALASADALICALRDCELSAVELTRHFAAEGSDHRTIACAGLIARARRLHRGARRALTSRRSGLRGRLPQLLLRWRPRSRERFANSSPALA